MKQEKKFKRRIYIDTNVLVGSFRKIKADSEALKYLFQLKDNELYTSALAISQTISTLQGKRKSVEYRRQIVDYINVLLHKISVIGFVEPDIKKAMAMENVDIEDNIQFVLGSKERCFIYVTNNVKDFKYNSVYAVKPEKVRSIPAFIKIQPDI